MKSLIIIMICLLSLSASAEELKVLRMEVAPGHYTKSQNIDFIATIAGVVTVSGTPTLFLNVGPMLRRADYISGSGTNTLTFRYVVEAEDYDLDGIEDFGMIKEGRIDSVDGRRFETVYPGPHQRKQVFVDARITNSTK